MPGRSALTVTPWTAATRADGAAASPATSSCRATTVVTASGGGWNEAAWRDGRLDLAELHGPDDAEEAPPPPTSITIIRLVMEYSLGFSHESGTRPNRLDRPCPVTRSLAHGTAIDDSALNYDP